MTGAASEWIVACDASSERLLSPSVSRFPAAAAAERLVRDPLLVLFCPVLGHGSARIQVQDKSRHARGVPVRDVRAHASPPDLHASITMHGVNVHARRRPRRPFHRRFDFGLPRRSRHRFHRAVVGPQLPDNTDVSRRHVAPRCSAMTHSRAARVDNVLRYPKTRQALCISGARRAMGSPKDRLSRPSARGERRGLYGYVRATTCYAGHFLQYVH